MTAKFQRLKDELKSLEEEKTFAPPLTSHRGDGLFKAGLSSPKWLKHILLAGFLGTFFLYAGITYLGESPVTAPVDNPIQTVQSWLTQPNEDLLRGMGSWMEEMGYADLSREDLIALREQGVTATFVSRMRDLGYTALTLDQAVRLSQNDVSSTFAAMMKELGYELSIDELVNLRQHGVTAYYTSNLHDLGYTEVTLDELVRLRDTGVTTSEAEQLIEQREGERPTIDELIRYHISNQ